MGERIRHLFLEDDVRQRVTGDGGEGVYKVRLALMDQDADVGNSQ
jgi:hypothetical protein